MEIHGQYQNIIRVPASDIKGKDFWKMHSQLRIWRGGGAEKIY